jgi:hypothetical protein
MIPSETNASRDFALLLCRVGFLLALVAIASVWWRLSADDRFYAVIIALAGSIALASSTSFAALCSNLLYFGWITVGFALLTVITGYSVGWHRVRVVESASGILPLILGLLLVAVALGAKKLVRKT